MKVIFKAEIDFNGGNKSNATKFIEEHLITIGWNAKLKEITFEE